MKSIRLVALLLSMSVFISCDFRSGIAKDEMYKFSGTPTPTTAPVFTPTPAAIDPAEVVQVDTSLDGETLSVSGDALKQSLTCPKYNSVRINGDTNNVTIKGTCRQVMVNGDNNNVTADAAMEFVFNGTSNTLKYSRYANGKWPSITQNQAGNLIEKIPYQAGKSGNPEAKTKQ
ncbi:MAG: DUF3060 domain-containing protein [Pyrinomonadaceae bacterium]